MKNLLHKVLVISLLVLLSGWYVMAQCPIVPDPVTGFSENFNNDTSLYFTLAYASQSNAYYANGEVVMTGGSSPTGWTGVYSGTTATNAWIDNVTHQASAVSCTVDATGMTHPELKIDLKQTYSYSLYYSWFRVLINGTQIGDVNSVTDFHPVTQSSDSYQTYTFDLLTYAGTSFVVTFESSCKYVSDASFFDNVIIHEHPVNIVDIGVTNILAPVTGCNLGAAEHVQVEVKNYGSGTLTDPFDIKYTVNGGSTISQTVIYPILPGATHNFTFTVAESFSPPQSYNVVAWTEITGDANNTNNSTSVIIYSYGVVTSFPYYENFNSNNGGWLSGGINSTWEWGVPPYPYLPAYKSPTDAFYKTNLNGWYNNNELSWVESPCFDLSAFTMPTVLFYAWYNLEPDVDYAYFEYSLNGGLTWSTYENYTGTSGWYGWSYSDPLWAGQPNVKFRFLFISDPYNNTYDGFAFDNFSISQISYISDLVATLVSPNGCDLSSFAVTINVENIGTTTINQTIPASYQIDANTPVTQNISVNLTPGQNQNFTLATGLSVSYGFHNLNTWITFSDDEPLNNNAASVLYHIGPISTFPYNENFASVPNNLGLESNSSSTIQVTNGAVKMTGVDGSTWIGGSSSNGTTSTQAWVDNASHHASAYTCYVNAGGLSTLEMLFDLKQEFIYGIGYSWFHVMINGTPIADVNGFTDFRPSLYGNPVWKGLRFDLTAYAGTTFEISLEASNAYAGNVAWIDNLVLRQKFAYDASLEKVVAPVSGCDLTATDKVTVQVKNWGENPISYFWVFYQKNGGLVHNKQYTTPLIGSGATANIQFSNTEDFTAGGTVTAWVILSGDGDATNDTYSGYTVTNLYDNLTVPYIQDFETEVTSTGGWAVQDANYDGYSWLWDSGHPLSPLNAYGFAYHYGAGNDWLFTKCFNLTAGNTYEIRFWYSTFPYWTTPKSLKVYYGNGQSASSMSTSLIILNNVVTYDIYEYAMQKFVPPVSGTYYFGFKAEGNQTINAQYILIDDVKIKKIGLSDLEIIAVNTPVDECVGNHTATEPVNITIKNNHLVPVEGDVISMGTPINVSYSVNGGVPVTETIILTADFYPGNTLNYTFVAKADLSAVGTYNFDIWITYPFEALPANDHKFPTVYTWPLPSFTFGGLSAGYCLGGTPSILAVNPPSYSTGYYTLSPFVAGMLTDNFDGTALFSPIVASALPYSVTYHFTDLHGCYNTYSQSTYVTDLSAFSMTPPGPVYNTLFPETLVLDAGAGYDAYLWSTLDVTQSILIPDTGSYSVIVTLHSCSASSYITVTNTEDHNINLRTGWGMFSTYLNITSNLSSIMMADPDVAYLTYPAKNLIIVKDELGQVFWWDLPTPIDQIGPMIPGRGYQYKMHAPAVLNLSGVAVKPQFTPINLNTIPSGHYIIGYLRRTADAITTQLAGIYSNVVLVVDEDGLVWWPYFGINYIGNLNPGKGYKIYVSSGCVLTYSANTPGQIVKNELNNYNPQYYRNINNTGNNMALCIPKDAWSSLPLTGDEIGIFKGDMLVGGGVYDGGNIAITIWGDDAMTPEIDGMLNNETYAIKLWHQTSNTEEILKVTSWIEGNDQFSVNGISVVGKLQHSGFESNDFALFQNVPNPYNDRTEISFFLPEDTNVELNIYNVYGELVITLVSSEMKAGLHKLTVNENLASGNYYYKLITDKYVGIKSMTVAR